MTEPIRLNIPRCELGEGPLWDAARQQLIVTDIDGKKLHFHSLGGETRTLSLPQKAGFAALTPDGLALGMEDGAYLLPAACVEKESVSMDELVPLHPKTEIAGVRFNDGKPGPDGRIYGGTIEKGGHGKLWRIADGAMETALDGVTISNGLAWTADGKTMYYCDTFTCKVDAFDFDPETGAMTNRRTAVEFFGLNGRPDGLCIDETGMLWVAVWGEGAVYRANPATGEKTRAVEIPNATHTSCTCFAGEQLDTLVITTAYVEGEENSGLTFAVKPGVRGTLPFIAK